MQEWFEGMSEKFLSVRGAKLLVLAGTDRLDKPLMIAQMQGSRFYLYQGKYQLSVIPESGHCIQEDVPDKLAQLLSDFAIRNKPLDLSKIRKVSLK